MGCRLGGEFTTETREVAEIDDRVKRTFVLLRALRASVVQLGS